MFSFSGFETNLLGLGVCLDIHALIIESFDHMLPCAACAATFPVDS